MALAVYVTLYAFEGVGHIRIRIVDDRDERLTAVYSRTLEYEPFVGKLNYAEICVAEKL